MQELISENTRLLGVQIHNSSTISLVAVESKQEKVKSEAYGAVMLFTSSILFSVMALLARYVTAYKGMPISLVIVLRGGVQTFLSLLSIYFLLDYKEVIFMSRDKFALVLLRGLFGGIAIALHLAALSLIPFGIASSLFYLNPVLAVLLSSHFLSESIGITEVVATGLSFIGVVLVSLSDNGSTPVAVNTNLVLGVSISILSAFSISLAFIITRYLGKQVSFMANVLSLGISMIGIGFFFCLRNMSHYSHVDKKTFFLATISCVCGFGTQCFLNKGFQHCRAGIGSILRTIGVPLSFGLGVTFLNEVPYLVSCIGSGLVVLSAILIGIKSLFPLKGAKYDTLR